MRKLCIISRCIQMADRRACGDLLYTAMGLAGRAASGRFQADAVDNDSS